MALPAMACLSLLWGVLLSAPYAGAFQPLFYPGSLTHRDITKTAILLKVSEVCHDQSIAQGRAFSLPMDGSLTVTKLRGTCSNTSALAFRVAVAEVYLSNAQVDLRYALSSKHHIDDENFTEGRSLITMGVAAVKASVKRESFLAARLTLGAVCHTLQDFYSHSNWVELGQAATYSPMTSPDLPLSNLAGPNLATCRSCVGGNCSTNLLPSLRSLTSGYFSLLSSAKPAGKCSHGGFFDRTSRRVPIGGINKDKITASHGHLHLRAAHLAINATMQLLQDVRLATGDTHFLRLMGMSQSSALCFVIDTTGSMEDDIIEAKRVAFRIIDSKTRSSEPPSEYILVPFNDPDFGPVLRTGDVDVFMQSLVSLTAEGGGDLPEPSLSALQLALAVAPPSSQIFLFTDAPAKDVVLKGTVEALIENTKSTVTFMLTDPSPASTTRGTSRHWRRSTSRWSVRMQTYRDLALTSGGLTIEVTKATLPQATAVIEDALASTLVTVLRARRENPVRAEKFSFLLDESLSNITIYISGGSFSFILYSPTGVSQSESMTGGPLGTIWHVGNLCRIQLHIPSQTGLWRISISSAVTYSLKVSGQSSVDFFYNVVETFEGPHADLALKEGRPLLGENIILLMGVTGGDSVSVAEVALVEASGSAVVNGTVEEVDNGDFLVTIDRMPEGEFMIRLLGKLGGSSDPLTNQFQRFSTTQVKGSRISINLQPNSTLLAGTPYVLPFTLTTTTSGGVYTVRARNDLGFPLACPSTMTLESRGSAQGVVTLAPPPSTPPGTVMMLIIQAEGQGATDSNYATLRLVVMAEVTDFTRPSCRFLSIKANCPTDCSAASWELSAIFSDGNGTGIERVAVQHGNGTVIAHTEVDSAGTNVTIVSYSASCCLGEVELIAVDAVGNVGTCFMSARDLHSHTLSQSPLPSGSAAQTGATSSCVLLLLGLLLAWPVLGY